jgi:hypothetical protein
LKLFVIAALSAALWAAPTAAAQRESSSDYDVSAAQNVSVTPDPAPAPAPVQPTPDPVPAPEPASTSPGGETAPPPAQSAPSEPATPAPEPAAPAPQPAPEPVVPDTPPAAASAGDAPVNDNRPQRSGRRDRGKPHPSEKDRAAPADKVNPIPVISEVGPLAEGLRDRARDAGPPIAVAALALLTLALTSGAFLLVATRRTGAWRT